MVYATAAFREALGVTPAAGRLVGLEHEYRVLRNGAPIDFREVLHTLSVPGRRLDPGDSNAYRCWSGLALTCDDAEAEIASPPVPLRPTFTTEIDGWARSGRALLTSLLPADVALDGFSTHLSVAVKQGEEDPAARRFAQEFAPAVMLVLDRPAAHGVFVRPRPGRLELCGDYALGPRLRAATAFVGGAVRACASEPSHLPQLALRVLRARGRRGLELDRHVLFGFDLYRQGRGAQLPLAGGGTITAQRYLEEAWTAARANLAGRAYAADLRACDRVVDGSEPLGVESGVDDVGAPVGPPSPSPYGDLLRTRHRPGYRVTAVVATWNCTVLALVGEGRCAYACLPRADLGRFLTRLDEGRLDAVLAAFLRVAPAGLRLSHLSQAAEPGLWDELTVSGDLVPLEPEPRPAGALVGKRNRVIAARRGKPAAERVVPPPSPPAGSGPATPSGPEPPVSVRRAPHTGPAPAKPTTPGPVPPMSPTPVTPPEPTPPPPVGPPEPMLLPPPVTPAEPTGPVPPEPAGPMPPEQPIAVPAQPVPFGPGSPEPTPSDPTVPVGPVPGDPASGGGVTPLAEQPVSPLPSRPGRPRATVLVAIVLALAGVAVAVVVVLVGGSKPAVQVVSTSVPRPTAVTTPAATTTTAITSVPATTASTEAATTITNAPSTTVAPPQPTTAPTTATTTPPGTTGTTTSPSTSTSTTTTAPQPFVITIGAACTFMPAAATRPIGSVIRFRNTTGAAVTIVGDGPPGSADVFFTVNGGAESPPYTLTLAGTYEATCQGGGGKVAITAN